MKMAKIHPLKLWLMLTCQLTYQYVFVALARNQAPLKAIV